MDREIIDAFMTLYSMSVNIFKFVTYIYLTATADRKFSKFFFYSSTWWIATFVIRIGIIFFLNDLTITVIVSHNCCFGVALEMLYGI